MSVYAAAYRQQANTGWTRIDLVLALFDGAIERVELALRATAQRHPAVVKANLDRAQLMVAALISGTNLEGDQTSQNLVRLYEYALFCIGERSPERLKSVLDVLRTVREGFQGIREEAQRLERTGAIPPADSAVLRECCA